MTVRDWVIDRLLRLTGLSLGGAALVAALWGGVPQTVRAAAPHPAMWVVRGGQSTVYLFGTIHVMKDDVKWLTPNLRQRFESADALWLEVPDLDNMTAVTQAAQKYSVNPAGDMTRGLTPEEIAQIDTLTAPYGLSAQRMQGVKKWAVGLFITTQQIAALGYNPRIGVDITLLDGARYLDKPVHGFETIDGQMQILAPKTDDEDVAALRAALKDSSQLKDELPPLLEAWESGDEDRMVHDLVDKERQEDPAEYQRMIVGRNQAWVPQVEQIIKGKGTTFIAVGTAHLIGPDSVIAQLRKDGFKVDRIDP